LVVILKYLPTTKKAGIYAPFTILGRQSDIPIGYIDFQRKRI
jgi:hypothetical protein